jgi:hypothetical protein
MTALNRNPINPNFLAPNKFQLNFARTPNLQYFCQTITLPGIATSEIAMPNPFVELYSPGEKAIYDMLNVTFYIDEELKTWLEIHDWIRGMTFPTDFAEYVNLRNLSPNISNTATPQFSDAVLTLYSSANIPYFRFKFYDCFPTSLSTFFVTSTDSPENPITADCTFRFSYYNVDKLF